MECQLKTRLDAVSCELNSSKQREEELIHSQKFLDEDLKQKNSTIKELEQKIEIIRHENDAQLKETVIFNVDSVFTEFLNLFLPCFSSTITGS